MNETVDAAVKRFEELLQEIDEALEGYDPPPPDLDQTGREVLLGRAALRPVLERVVELATRALEAFPHNGEILRGGLDLLGELHASSGLEDSKVAEIANESAERAQAMMLSARTLRIHALIDADREEEAQELAATWTRLFPDDEELKEAIP